MIPDLHSPGSRFPPVCGGSRLRGEREAKAAGTVSLAGGIVSSYQLDLADTGNNAFSGEHWACSGQGIRKRRGPIGGNGSLLVQPHESYFLSGFL